MMDKDFIKAIETLDKLDFFYGQRGGRELWALKPVDAQNEDLKNFSEDISFLKDFINEQNLSLKDVLHYLESLSNSGVDYKPHGKWLTSSVANTNVRDGWLEKHYITTYTCSICKTSIVGLKNMNYCPHCGAQMNRK